ncbi:MAG: methylated-DNA--[protein]-cysteine S-methyltransferase [Alphaproteobacteria bacterium]|nr:methylated-DNA--[protein]-cysteine S-methyltransferase [Alphaproteobacteria bacterium]
MRRAVLSTPLGPLHLWWSDAGLHAMDFDPARAERLVGAPPPAGDAPLDLAGAVHAFFRGDDDALLHWPLAPSGTALQQAAWTAVRAIPAGERLTYTELSIGLGRPDAVRAVAQANARNPVLLAVPCHRVVAADGGLGGYAGGLDRKRWLLAMESGQQPALQQSLF